MKTFVQDNAFAVSPAQSRSKTGPTHQRINTSKGYRMKIKYGTLGLILSAIGLCTSAAAGNIVTGSKLTAPVDLTSSSWQVMTWSEINISSVDSAMHSCFVVASVDVKNSGVEEVNANQYQFVISKNHTTPSLVNASARTVELIGQRGINDPNSVALSTNDAFNGLSSTNGPRNGGKHYLYLLGRKLSDDHIDTKVLSGSLSVVCVHQ